jgi:tetratricopeptide (TPR) repeat protein
VGKEAKKYKEASRLFYEYGKPEEALQIINNFGSPTRNLGWANLYMMVKEDQGKIFQAFYVVDAITTKYNHYFRAVKKSGVFEKAPGLVKKNLVDTYGNILMARGKLSFKLKKWKIMCDSYREYAERFPNLSKKDLAQSYMNMGVCSYKLRNYEQMAQFSTKAISYLERHNLYKSKTGLAEIYYNAGIAYAKMGDVENTIKFLRFPLRVDTKRFLEKIKKEGDFDNLIGKEGFTKFLNQYD